MGGTTDTLKGRFKEAAGVLADEDDLKEEGRMDQKIGKVKDAASRLADEVKESAARAAQATSEAADAALRKAEEAADEKGGA